MVRFYDYSLRLRQSPYDNAYKVHQRLDTLLQEGNDYRLPYCWHHLPSPIEGSSELLVRTMMPLGISGQHCTELTLVEGMELRFSVRLLASAKLPNSNSYHTIEWDQVIGRLSKSLQSMAGMELEHASMIKKELYFVNKKGLKKFPVPAFEAVVYVAVKDVALAETALVQGIGRRRAFGCGMLRDIEVL